VLSRRGVREPVHLLLTHPHGDHAGGWATLARLWPLASTSVPVTANAEDPWEPFRPTAGADPAGLLRGDVWSRGEAAFSVRWPPRAFVLPDANMVSLVLRVTWRDRELWLMGDALAIQERDLLDLGDPGSDQTGGDRLLAVTRDAPPGTPRVSPGPSPGHTPFPHRLLKVGHHGSRNASDPAWIAALNPEVVVIPAGFRNRFEHPHPETQETLRRIGLAPWVTGISSGVRVAVVEGGWRIDTGDGGSAFTPLRNNPKP
jgi:competence protein ComEC